MGFLHSLRVAIWGEPPPTKEERRLLFKIDWFILSYVCLMYDIDEQPLTLSKTSANPFALLSVGTGSIISTVSTLLSKTPL